MQDLLNRANELLDRLDLGGPLNESVKQELSSIVDALGKFSRFSDARVIIERYRQLYAQTLLDRAQQLMNLPRKLSAAERLEIDSIVNELHEYVYMPAVRLFIER
jgi:hypothetical protein